MAPAELTETSLYSDSSRKRQLEDTLVPSATQLASTEHNCVLKRLKAELYCALCSDLIIDAGILPCSHGFCYQVRV